jgi:hypothetical protein
MDCFNLHPLVKFFGVPDIQASDVQASDVQASGLKVPGHWPECPNPFRPVAAVGKFSVSKS